MKNPAGGRLAVMMLMGVVVGLIVFLLYWSSGFSGVETGGIGVKDGPAATASTVAVAEATASRAAVRTDTGGGASRSARAAAQKCTLIIRVSCASERDDGLDLTVMPSAGGGDAYLRKVTTDAKGFARLTDLAAGPVYVRGLGASCTGTLTPLRETTLQLEPEQALSVVGRIQTPDGAPIAGADVLTAVEGERLARSDASGRFRIPCIETGTVIAVEAEKYQRSDPVTIDSALLEKGELVVQLESGGCDVEGIVTEEDGTPVEGASLRLFRDAPEPKPQVLPHMARSSSSGEFRFRGLAPGNIRIRAHGGGCNARIVPWVAAKDDTKRCVIVLSKGAIVQGTVRTADGVPVEGAAVYTDDLPILQKYALSDADGNYQLTGVGPGSADLVARDAAGDVQRTVRLGVGELYHWDPILPSRGVVRGRVVDSAGRGVVGVDVTLAADASRGHWKEKCTSDADGGFQLLHCKRAANRIEVLAPDMPLLPPLAAKNDVYPGDTECVIALSDGTRPSAALVGRIINGRGEVILDARLCIGEAGSGSLQFVPLRQRNGSFRTRPLVPGRYDLMAEAPGKPPVNLGAYELERDSTVDLGEIRLLRGGTLRLHLIDEAGVDWAPPARATVTDARGRRVATSMVQKGVAEFSKWAPDLYHVELSLGGDRKIERDVEIQEDAVKEERITVGAK